MCNTANSVNAEQSNKWKASRLKYRKYDEALVKKAKTMLVHGHTVHKVALLLRLDPEFVAQLFETWNPRFRRISKPNQFTAQRMAKQLFTDGANLESICKLLDIPLFTAVEYLSQGGCISQAELIARMPESNHRLMADYRRTLARKQRSRRVALH